eukprot:TRINITY_DN1090_c0_g1_i1.p1 TRINITY_DN1090_c0_g1~~TRINITY_DN1090_c0_g1_i1.p1  ORF type:complete len:425 (-),score=83.16 TRINITY_DN1090_c0_g1_i1:228-1502(-)
MTGHKKSQKHNRPQNQAEAQPKPQDATESVVDEHVESVPPISETDSEDRFRRFWIRTASTLFMVVSFGFVIYGGHHHLCLLSLFIQVTMFKEIVNLGYETAKDRKLPYFRLLNWYHLFTTFFFLYGKKILTSYEPLFIDTAIWYIVDYHTFISFALQTSGFVIFVCTLKKGSYRYQFGVFAWTNMTLLLVPIQSSFVISNIFNGIIWFVLPSSLIVVNDITAYVCGFNFGKTSLIKLSPKKTWEGFIGATISTLIWGFVFTGWLSQYDWMVCPRATLSAPFVPCQHDSIFVPVIYTLPAEIQYGLSLLGLPITGLRIAPAQFHALWMAAFASIIAPFGGFFASGFKRAFKVKDFGESIPGHGGITDRMDCQLLMGLFTYVYFSSFVISKRYIVDRLVQQILNLSAENQGLLFDKLRETVPSLCQ